MNKKRNTIVFNNTSGNKKICNYFKIHIYIVKNVRAIKKTVMMQKYTFLVKYSHIYYELI